MIQGKTLLLQFLQCCEHVEVDPFKRCLRGGKLGDGHISRIHRLPDSVEIFLEPFFLFPGHVKLFLQQEHPVCMTLGRFSYLPFLPRDIEIHRRSLFPGRANDRSARDKRLYIVGEAITVSHGGALQ